MLILVTGGTGLLGNNVVRLLIERGMPVRTLVRATSDPRPLEGLSVERAAGDIRDVEAVRSACSGVDLVVHCAAHVHIGRTGLQLQEEVNIEGTRCVAEAALAAGCRMVHVSTIDAVGLGSRRAPADEQTPDGRTVLCPYVVTKRAAEKQVLQCVRRGLHAVIVNPGCMLGPWDWKPSSGRMLLEVARGRAWVAPRGVNCFCDVRDVAEGVLAAAELGQVGQRYILGGHSITYFEAWKVFARVTGVRPPILHVGPVILTITGVVGDLKTRWTGREGDVNSASVAMSRLPKYYSSRRAEEELGYRIRSVEEAAQAAWDWFQTHGYVPAK
jgi:dihydroflavonol-4-reductase